MTESPSTVAFTGADPAETDVVVVHATGFCKEVLVPMMRPVQAENPALRVTWLDQRGHGESAPHPGPFDWDALARDVLVVLDGAGQPVGIGHSSGGAAIARAEILAPGTFSQLILIEPIIFPPPYERRDIPLAAGAERRRRSFSSRDDARERFGAGPFADWDPEVLRLYVDHGFAQTEDGWTLRCEPWVEADFYREGSNVDTWDRLDQISCSVTVVTGARSDSHQDPYLGSLLNQFARADLVILDELGHLAPMEGPEIVGACIASVIDGPQVGPTIA